MPAQLAQAHGGEPVQARPVEVPWRRRLVGAVGFVGSQQPAQRAGHGCGIGGDTLGLAFERNGPEVKRGFACVDRVDPVMRGPGQEVGHEEGDQRVGAHGIEGRVALHTVQLDVAPATHEGQDRNLRVTAGRAGDQGPVAHLGDELVSGLLVGRVVAAREHQDSGRSRSAR